MNGDAGVQDGKGVDDDRLVRAGVGPVRDGGGARWYMRGTMTNMLVIVGFAAFAFVVKHVLTNVVDMK